MAPLGASFSLLIEDQGLIKINVSVPGTQLEGSVWTLCSREEEQVESGSLILKCGSSLFHAYFCALGK